MTDWLKIEAQKIKQRDIDAAAAKRAQEHAERSVAAGWRSFWSSVENLVVAAIHDFNKEFPDQPDRHIRIVSREPLTIERQDEDALLRIVQAAASGKGISIREITTFSDGKRESRDRLDIEFGVNAAGEVIAVQTGVDESAEDAAKAITQALFP
jgi:hypothetical protein